MQIMSKRKKFLRISVVLIVATLVCGGVFLFLKLTGLWENVNSVEKIRKFILSIGFYGRLFFVLLQFLQVTILPIPSTITTLAGVLIYGPLQTAFLSLSGILLGSLFAFWLGRSFGRKIVVYMVGEASCMKWTKFLTSAKYSFFVMMLFPIFPDDILCLVAGLTDMSWAFFSITNFISRPIGIFLTCYLGSGKIIPYQGWGALVWIFLLAFVGAILFLSFKYQDKIEGFLKRKFMKK